MRPLPRDAIRIPAARRRLRNLVSPGVSSGRIRRAHVLFGGQPIAHPNGKLLGTLTEPLLTGTASSLSRGTRPLQLSTFDWRRFTALHTTPPMPVRSVRTSPEVRWV